MRGIANYLIILILFISEGNLMAQDSVQYIFAGRMLDVKEGRIFHNVLLTITNDKITSVGANEDPSGISDYTDLSDFTLLPGLIDCHTHLTGNWHMDEDEFDEYRLPAAAYGILGTLNARKTLEAGFTTVRDVHSNFYGDVAIRDAITRGWIPGPRMYVTGPGLSITGGHGSWGNWLAPHLALEGNMISIADGEDEVRKETRRHLKYSVDWIKIFASGGYYSYGTTPGAPSYSIEEIGVAVDEARKNGRFVCAHAHGAEGIKNALKAGVRSVEHGTFLDDECIALFKEKKAFLVMDLMAAYYDLVETNTGTISAGSDSLEFTAYTGRFRRAYEAGVKMAFGSDAGVYPHGRNAEQFQLMVQAGMKEIDAIRSATLTAAELLGMQDLIGSIDEGYYADIIAVRGDPLSDITVLENVTFVMQGGRVVLME